MKDDVALHLARAKSDLEAARALTGAGFHAQAVSRAYYAVFYAAEAALLRLGETRSKHAGVIAAFGKRVVKEGGLEREIGAILHARFEQRLEADYGRGEVSATDAEGALRDAERFVAAVERWLATR